MQRKIIVTTFSFLMLFSLSAQTDSDSEAHNSTSAKRTLLEIPYSDREGLLRIMRGNLESLGKMIEAMSNDDFDAVQQISEKMSFNKKKGKGLARRGNKAFTAMGVQFHAVDTIAVMNAAKSKDRKATLQAMSKMVTTCVACHSSQQNSKNNPLRGGMVEGRAAYC